MSFETTIISIIVMIFIGVLLKKLNILKTEDNETLNKIVVNVALPCMIFNALYTANVSLLPDLSILTVFILICSLIIGVITYLILKFLAYDNKALWSILVVVVLGNTGFLGYPISQGIFGAEGLVRAAFCDLATSIIFIAVSIILIMIFDGEIKTAIKKIVTFMPLWGIILGILLNVFSIPIGEFGSSIVNYLGGSTVPLIMISLGLSLNLRGFKRHFKEVSLASIIKLIVYPLLAICILSILGIAGLEYKIGLLEAMMPSAMLALILSLQFKLDSDLTSDCIFTDTLLSLISIPVFLFIFII
ncbi:MAG: AEC family transporter [archaeon]|nr:AEC family transporter [archaeon]